MDYLDNLEKKLGTDLFKRVSNLNAHGYTNITDAIKSESGKIYVVNNGLINAYDTIGEFRNFLTTFENKLKRDNAMSEVFYIQTSETARIGNPISNRDRILEIISTLKDNNQQISEVKRYFKRVAEIEASLA
jgi:hypothetical protein